MKKSFLLHIDSLCILDDLTDEQKGQLFNAIYKFQLGEELELSPIIKIAFSQFRNQFNRDSEKYEKTCEARKLAGSKGGKQKVANASNSKQKVANVAENDNKNKKENDSDKENDNKKGTNIILEDNDITLAKRTITYLNNKANKSFKDGKGNLKEILAQIRKGATEEQLAHVINVKCQEWLKNQEMKKHLNPSTLFREANFDKYLNQDAQMSQTNIIDAVYEARRRNAN